MLQFLSNWLIAGGGYRRLTIVLCLLFGVGATHRKQLLLLAARIRRLIRNNGTAYTVATLKECHRLVYARVSGEELRVSISPPFVGVRQGLPSLVPSVLRSEILQSHRVLTMLTLTLLGTYRGLVTPPKIKLESITNGFTGNVEHFMGFSDWVPQFVGQLQLPQLGRPRLWLSTSVGPHGLTGSVSAIRDAAAMLSSCNGDLLGFWWSFGCGVYGRGARMYMLWIAMHFFSFVHWILFRPWTAVPGVTSWLSRLHRIEEAAGKVRIVAICDYWTQALMRPIHDYVFKILRNLPQDGTFDQEGAVSRFKDLVSKKQAAAVLAGQTLTVYSLDLSSATDRIPTFMYQVLLALLIGEEQATLWKHLLTARAWWDRDSVWSPEEGLTPSGPWLKRLYAVGQPMGAYSSWALLALAHHAIVQYCAHLEGLQGWFEDYVIVGDDVAIAHEGVAKRYLAVMVGLGIEISMDKSLVSRSGVFEFCKRLVTPGGDVTGIPVKLIYQLVRYPSDFGVLIRHLGRRGFLLFPIAVARAMSAHLGISTDLRRRIGKLQIEINVAFATLVQSAYPWWRGIWLLIHITRLSVEELEEVLRTGRKIPSDEMGAYGKLETRAFKGWTDRLRPGNWTRALETVPDGVIRWINGSSMLSLAKRLRLNADASDRLRLFILRWGTPLGWWLMISVMSQVLLLLGFFYRALIETSTLPGVYTVAWKLTFLNKRVRDRVLETYRGNALEYLVAVTKTRTRSALDFTLSADANRRDRAERRRASWVIRALAKYPGTLPEYYGSELE